MIRRDMALIALVALLSALIIVISARALTRPVIPYEQPRIILDESPHFIWTYRGLDMFVLGFMLLSTVLAVAALLREEEGPGVEEEAVVEE